MANNNEASTSSAVGGTAAPSRPSHVDLPEAVAAKLTDEKGDMQSKAAAAQEFKELLELYHNNNYAHFVKNMVPASLKALETIPCSMLSDSPEQVCITIFYKMQVAADCIYFCLEGEIGDTRNTSQIASI